MLNSIRYRLLAWFIAFMLLTAGLILPANFIYRYKEKSITQFSTDINSLYIQFLRDTKNVNDFLTTEPGNSDFFTKGESPYLKSHQQTSRELFARLRLICNSGQAENFGLRVQLEQLTADLNRYTIMFDSLVYLVYKRGYRNFGLEGELSDYALLLEEAGGLTNRDIYQLRKIENNYFFNEDTASVSAFLQLIGELNSNIYSGNRLSLKDKEKTANLLNNYSGAFLRLVELNRQAGISRNMAQRASLNSMSSQVEGLFSALIATSATTQKALISRLNMVYILSLLLIISMAIFFSYKAAKHVVSHLEALTNYISSLAKNRLEGDQSIDLHNSAREIKQIYREFRNLLSQLKIWEKQRDSALRHADDNQQRYRELADMLPQSVFETDSYGNYTYVNKAWHQAFGYGEEDLREGLNLIETLISESSSEDILGFHKIENSSFMALRKNGSRFPASVYTDNIVKDGRISGRRGIIIDITERANYIKSLQQETTRAKTSDELKSSFLANMSHEIRTPMNSIIGFSNLLASEKVPDIQKRDFTQYIRTSSEILLNLVDDIIDIAKIEAGELKIVKKDCELNALCTELLTTSLETRKRFNKQHLQLSFNHDRNHPEVYLKTDPFRLRQILVNLINNAIKFTDKGSVEFGYTLKDDSIIEFCVKDTGPGLSREELDVIFERFKRAKRSDEKNIAGTGLGLAISKNLVQLLGGEMWVDSVAGSGTTFMFTLPYLRSTVISTSRDERFKGEVQYNWQGKTILIAEDDPNSFRFLSELLRKTGADIIHAPNGKKAVEAIAANDNINMVIMDINLPVMDGIEATQKIKALRSLPVIAQTAYAMAGDREKMKLAGCDEYLAKPLDMVQFMATIHHFMFAGTPALQQELPHDQASNPQ